MTSTRPERTAWLARAGRDELVALADACLADGAEPHVVLGPEVGTLATQVREPVARERFLLGDVLACRAEVELGGARGWALRLGEDRVAALAAALCDAEVEAGRPHAAEVLALCGRVADRVAAQRSVEWSALSPTVVEFEELA